MCHGDAPSEGCEYSDMTPRKLFMLPGCQIRRHPGRGAEALRGAFTRERAPTGRPRIFEASLSGRENHPSAEGIAPNTFEYLTHRWLAAALL